MKQSRRHRPWTARWHAAGWRWRWRWPVATVTRGAACCRQSSGCCRCVGRGGGHGDALWGPLAPGLLAGLLAGLWSHRQLAAHAVQALPVCQWSGHPRHAATVLRGPLQRRLCQVPCSSGAPASGPRRRRERTRHVEGSVTIANPSGKAVRQQVGQPLPSFRGQTAHGNAALPQACVLQQSKTHQDCRPAATIRTR